MSSSSDDAPCGSCQQLVCRGQKGLDCDLCESWYHIECAAVSTTCYNAIRKGDGLMWFCPTCRSALHGALKKLEILSAENAALREEVREVRQAVEPTSCAGNCEEEQISPRPAGCNTGVNSSRSCPTVCAESGDALHPLPPKREEGAKEAGHRRESNLPRRKNMAQRHTNKRPNVPDDLPEIRFLRNVDKSLTVNEIRAALHKARVRTDDCFIEQTVPQEEFMGRKKFIRIILPNRMRADEFASGMKRNGDLKWQFSRKPPVVGIRESYGAVKPTGSSGLPPSNHPAAMKPSFLCSGPPRPRRPPLPPPQLQPGLLPPPLLNQNWSLPPQMKPGLLPPPFPHVCPSLFTPHLPMLPLPLPQMQGPQLAPPNPHPHLPPKLISLN